MVTAGYGFVGTGQKSKHSQLLARSISAHPQCSRASVCVLLDKPMSRGDQRHEGRVSKETPSHSRPGPDPGTRPAKGETRNGTRLRSNTGGGGDGKVLLILAKKKKKKNKTAGVGGEMKASKRL